jgi:hypothetical protein
MRDDENHLDEILTAGNKFALTFTVFFGFVFFVIIEPHFSRDRSPEIHVDRSLAEVDVVENALQERRREVLAERDQDLKRASRKHAPDEEWDRVENKAKEGWLSASEKLIQLGVARQTLSKAKLEKKQYTIPLIAVSIDEETLLKFFPIVTVLCLARLFFYRLSLLQTAQEGDDRLPLWAAPVPFRKTGLWKWTLVNLSGFLFGGSIVLLTLRFLLMYARENPPRLLLAAADAALLVLWSIFYLVVLAVAMFGFPRASSPSKEIAFE